MKHFLCGTCVGELERHCGYFEALARRAAINWIKRIGQHDVEFHGPLQYCCACGAKGHVFALVTFVESARICDGKHEPVEDD